MKINMYKKIVIGIILIILLTIYLLVFKLNIYVHNNITLSNQYFLNFEDELQVSNINIWNHLSGEKINFGLFNYLKDKKMDVLSIGIQLQTEPISRSYDFVIDKVVVKTQKGRYVSSLIKKDFRNMWDFEFSEFNNDRYLNEDSVYSVSKSLVKNRPAIVTIAIRDKDKGKFNFSISFDEDVQINKGSKISVYYTVGNERASVLVFNVTDIKYRYDIITRISENFQNL